MSSFPLTYGCFLIGLIAPDECRARSVTKGTSDYVANKTSGSPEPPALNLITDATALIAENPPVDDSGPDTEGPHSFHPPSDLLAPVDVPLSGDHAVEMSLELPVSEPLFQPVPESTQGPADETDTTPLSSSGAHSQQRSAASSSATSITFPTVTPSAASPAPSDLLTLSSVTGTKQPDPPVDVNTDQITTTRAQPSLCAGTPMNGETSPPDPVPQPILVTSQTATSQIVSPTLANQHPSDPQQPTDHLTAPSAETTEPRRSNRVSQPFSRVTRVVPRKNISRPPPEVATTLSIDTSLLRSFPQPVLPLFNAIVDSAELGEVWTRCIAQWLLIESRRKQVGFLFFLHV